MKYHRPCLFDNNYGIIYIFIKNIETIFLNKKHRLLHNLILKCYGHVCFLRFNNIFEKKLNFFYFFLYFTLIFF
jgi:hypothetical protein